MSYVRTGLRGSPKRARIRARSEWINVDSMSGPRFTDPEIRGLITEYRSHLSEGREDKAIEIRNSIVARCTPIAARAAADVSRRYYAHNATQHTFEDLFSESLLSLFPSIDRFDLSKDTKFSTYAFRSCIYRLMDYAFTTRLAIRRPVWLGRRSRAGSDQPTTVDAQIRAVSRMERIENIRSIEGHRSVRVSDDEIYSSIEQQDVSSTVDSALKRLGSYSPKAELAFRQMFGLEVPDDRPELQKYNMWKHVRTYKPVVRDMLESLVS